MKSQRIMVTGAQGFIGTHLIKALRRDESLKIIPVDHKLGHELLSKESLDSLPNADVIIHLAAKMSVTSAWDDPYPVYNMNINATLNMLEFARKRGVQKFIYPSSYVYGAPQYLPVDEKHPVAANNPYTRSKLLGEYLCRSYSQDFNIPTVILRIFNVYGPGLSGIFLIPTIISQLRTHRIVLKDSAPKRDYIYISDVVAAFLKAVDLPVSPFEVFNIGYGVSYTVSEVVNLILKLSAVRCDAAYTAEQRRNEIPDIVASIAKAKQLLNWEPKVSLEDGLIKMLMSSDYLS